MVRFFTIDAPRQSPRWNEVVVPEPGLPFSVKHRREMSRAPRRSGLR